MTKHNADNERIKRKYFAYLKEAMRIWLSPMRVRRNSDFLWEFNEKIGIVRSTAVMGTSICAVEFPILYPSELPWRNLIRTAQPSLCRLQTVFVTAVLALFAGSALSSPRIYPTGVTIYDPARAYNSFVSFSAPDVKYAPDRHEWK